MLSSVASAQFVITAVVALVTAIVLGVLFTTVPLSVIHGSSSLLALLLVSMFLVVVAHLPDSFLWAALMNQALDRTQCSVDLLFYYGTAIHCLTAFFDCSTIGLLLQKTLVLGFPQRKTTYDVKVIFLGIALTTGSLMALMVVTDVFSVTVNIHNLANDCNSRRCLYGLIAPGRSFYTSSKLVLSLCSMCLGVVFLVLSHKRRSSIGIAFDRSTNSFIKYFFVLRLVFESIPLFLDLLLYEIFFVEVTVYVGPYPKFGLVVDTFLSAGIFYVLLGHRTSYSKTTKVQTTFTLDKKSNVSPAQGELFRASVTKP
ncbi:hypothetical protein QR680_009784 [Steinernema hermaphroditum]|uniref:Uncharacterized protein n=1 Tax=Steinernema hermaphroditum TaxID=289476 RepID=A0AA39IMY5_9BILA|nr:hypothetical protein QR680_009784 [Steinernema hermaphroditum]